MSRCHRQEIHGVEIKRFVSHDRQATLVPMVVGKTVNAEGIKGKSTSPSTQWNEETFFAALDEQCGHEQAQVAKDILNWINPYCKYIWFGEGKRGYMFPVPNLRDQYSPVFSLWIDGSIELQFQRMSHTFDKEEKRLELLLMFNQIDGVNISEAG